MVEMDNTRREAPYVTYWFPKYAIYNEISSVDYLCELSGAAAGLLLPAHLI